MESFVENLKQDVQCSLCNDTLTEPKILKCFHSFCKHCIKRHAELIQEVNVFKCPKCKSETPLPELNSVDDLKPSVLHSRTVKVLEFVESEKVCSVSGSHPPASWHCLDCNRSLCDECEKGHSMFTKDHKGISLVETKAQDIKVMMTRDTNCVDHVDKIVELFCRDCEEIICLECLKHDHEGHWTITLSTHAKTKRALLADKLEQLETRQQTMEKKFKAMQEVTEELREHGEEEKREIKKKMEETIKQLEVKATELMKQIDEDVEKAERMKAEGQSVLDQTRGVMEYMKALMEKGTQTDVIQLEYLDCDENILESNEQIEKIQHLGKYFEFNEELLKQEHSSLGTLRKLETDHKTSTVEAQGELQVAKESRLIISTRSKTGRLTRHITDVIDVKISPKENVEIKENFVRTDGKIEVEFMAKVAGQLTAEVQVNGKHVSNSPLKINIVTGEFKIKGINTESSDFTGVAVNEDNSKIAVADQSAHCVYISNSDGKLVLTYTNVRSPQGISFLNKTDLVIADYNNHRICIVNTATGTLVKTFGSKGNGNGQFLYPQDVHVDDDGNIVVCDLGNHRVQVFTQDGEYQYQFGSKAKENFCPVSAVTKRGRFYVSDYTENVILVFEKRDGVMTRTSTIGGPGSAAGQLSQPWGLAIDDDHHLLVCDRESNRIQKITLYGRLVDRKTCGCASPKYLAVLKNDRELLVTSQKSVLIYSDSR